MDEGEAAHPRGACRASTRGCSTGYASDARVPGSTGRIDSRARDACRASDATPASSTDAYACGGRHATARAGNAGRVNSYSRNTCRAGNANRVDSYARNTCNAGHARRIDSRAGNVIRRSDAGNGSFCLAAARACSSYRTDSSG
jgi:hypothetical protein